jgi:hypothetical protein
MQLILKLMRYSGRRDQENRRASPIRIYYIHTDHLNTSRVIVSRNNVAVWRWENTHVFGANLSDESPM